MAEEIKYLKSIIKQKPSAFLPRDDRRSTSPSDHSKKLANLEDHHHSGYFQLAVPAFFGGSKHTEGSHPKSSFASIESSLSSGDDRHMRSGQRVRFLDRLSVRTISATQIVSSFQDVHGFGDRERLVQLQDIQDDPYYLPGFVDLYYAKEIAIVEDTCCCSIHTSYKIKDDISGKPIYAVEKEIDGTFLAFFKFCCCRKYDLMRIGYTIRVFNTAINTKLLTFKRKTHVLADQLDIVETYYSIENSHVGRIEKTKDGYRLIDQKGTETFRILRESKREEKCLKFGGTLIVFDCETRKVVAKISYVKRKFLGRLCSMFMSNIKHTIRWSQEIGVAMKTLLLGVLFLELHSMEEYVDLPLGRDANLGINTTKNRLASL